MTDRMHLLARTGGYLVVAAPNAATTNAATIPDPVFDVITTELGDIPILRLDQQRNATGEALYVGMLGTDIRYPKPGVLWDALMGAEEHSAVTTLHPADVLTDSPDPNTSRAFTRSDFSTPFDVPCSQKDIINGMSNHAEISTGQHLREYLNRTRAQDAFVYPAGIQVLANGASSIVPCKGDELIEKLPTDIIYADFNVHSRTTCTAQGRGCCDYATRPDGLCPTHATAIPEYWHTGRYALVEHFAIDDETAIALYHNQHISSLPLIALYPRAWVPDVSEWNHDTTYAVSIDNEPTKDPMPYLISALTGRPVPPPAVPHVIELPRPWTQKKA